MRVWVGRWKSRTEIFDKSNHDTLGFNKGNSDIYALNFRVPEVSLGKRKSIITKDYKINHRAYRYHKIVHPLRVELIHIPSLDSSFFLSFFF